MAVSICKQCAEPGKSASINRVQETAPIEIAILLLIITTIGGTDRIVLLLLFLRAPRRRPTQIHTEKRNFLYGLMII